MIPGPIMKSDPGFCQAEPRIMFSANEKTVLPSADWSSTNEEPARMDIRVGGVRCEIVWQAWRLQNTPLIWSLFAIIPHFQFADLLSVN